jgi:hypothetical protein
MRKQPEVEDGIRSIIRDELALNPLISVQKMRVILYKHRYQSANGSPLDWHYVGKLMRKVRAENIARLSTEDWTERIAAVRERHRIIAEKLGDIVDGKPFIGFGQKIYPTARDRVAAANVILKWDYASLFFESQLLPKKTTKKQTRAMIVVDELTETTIPSLPEARGQKLPDFGMGMRRRQARVGARSRRVGSLEA